MGVWVGVYVVLVGCCCVQALALCQAPGFVLFEERFERAHELEDPQGSLPGRVWSNFSSPDHNGWWATSNSNSNGKPKFDGWVAWDSGALTNAGIGFDFVSSAFIRGGVAVLSPSGFSSARMFSESKLTSPEIAVGNVCGNVTLKFASYFVGQYWLTPQVELAWFTSDHVHLHTNITQVTASGITELTLQVPANAKFATIAFFSSRSSVWYYYETSWTLDNVVFSVAESTNDTNAFCDTFRHLGSSWSVWKGGDGSWNLEENWCGGETPSQNALLVCRHQKTCIIETASYISVAKILTDPQIYGDIVLRISSGTNLRVGATILQHVDLRQGSLSGNVTILGQLQLYSGSLWGQTRARNISVVRGGHGRSLSFQGKFEFNPEMLSTFELQSHKIFYSFSSLAVFVIHPQARVVVSFASSVDSLFIVHGELVVVGSAPSFNGGIMLKRGSRLLVRDTVTFSISNYFVCTGGSVVGLSPGITFRVNSLIKVGIADQDCEFSSNLTLEAKSGCILSISSQHLLPTRFVVNGAHVTVQPGANTSSIQSIDVKSGSLSFDDPQQILSAKSVILSASGTLRIHSQANIDSLVMILTSTSYGLFLYQRCEISEFDWQGGKLSSSGLVNVTLTKRLTISNTQPKRLQGVRLAIPQHSVSNWQQGNLDLNSATIVVPENSTLKVVLAGQSLTSSTGSLHNFGHVVLVGTLTSSQVSNSVQLDNRGVLEIQTGTMIQHGSFVSHGTIKIGKSAAFAMHSTGNKEFASSSKLVGSGSILINDGTSIRLATPMIDPLLRWEITGGSLSVDVVATIHLQSTWVSNSGKLRSEHGATLLFDELKIGGDVYIVGNWTAQRVNLQGGMIRTKGSGRINYLEWTAGAISGDKKSTVVVEDGLICGTSSLSIADVELQIERTFLWRENAILNTASTAQVVVMPGGVLQFATGRWNAHGKQFALINNGTIHFKMFAETASFPLYVSIVSFGNLVVEQGLVSVTGLQLYGALSVAQGAKLSVTTSAKLHRSSTVHVVNGLGAGSLDLGGTALIESGVINLGLMTCSGTVLFSRFAGAVGGVGIDTLRVASGSMTVDSEPTTVKFRALVLSGGDVTLRPDFDVQSLTISSASSQLRVLGTLVVETDFIWSAGNLVGFISSEIQVRGKLLLLATNGQVTGTKITAVAGVVVAAGYGSFGINEGAQLVIPSGSVLLFEQSQFSISGLGTLTIDGNITAGVAESLNSQHTFAVNTILRGVANIVAGTVIMQRNFLHQGRFFLAKATTLKLRDSSVFSSSSRLEGAGSLVIESGANVVTLAEVFSPGSILVTYGTLTVETSQARLGSISISSAYAHLVVAATRVEIDALVISGGDATFETVDWSCSHLSLNTNGHLLLDGSGIVTGSFDFASGTIEGVGGELVVVTPTSSLSTLGTCSLKRALAFQHGRVDMHNQLQISSEGTLRVADNATLSVVGESIAFTGDGQVFIDGAMVVAEPSCATVNMKHVALGALATLHVPCSALFIELLSTSRQSSILLGSKAKLVLSSDTLLQANITGYGELHCSQGRVVLSNSGNFTVTKLSTTSSTATLQVEHASSSVFHFGEIVASQGAIALHSESPVAIDALTVGNGEVYVEASTRIDRLVVQGGKLRVASDTTTKMLELSGTCLIVGTSHLSSVDVLDSAVVTADSVGLSDIVLTTRGRFLMQNAATSFTLSGRAILEASGQTEIATQLTLGAYQPCLLVIRGTFVHSPASGAGSNINCNVQVESGAVLQILHSDWTQLKPLFVSHGGIVNASLDSSLTLQSDVDSMGKISVPTVVFSGSESYMWYGPRSGEWQAHTLKLETKNGYTTFGAALQRLSLTRLLLCSGIIVFEGREVGELVGKIAVSKSGGLMLHFVHATSIPELHTALPLQAGMHFVAFEDLSFDTVVEIEGGSLEGAGGDFVFKKRTVFQGLQNIDFSGRWTRFRNQGSMELRARRRVSIGGGAILSNENVLEFGDGAQLRGYGVLENIGRATVQHDAVIFVDLANIGEIVLSSGYLKVIDNTWLAGSVSVASGAGGKLLIPSSTWMTVGEPLPPYSLILELFLSSTMELTSTTLYNKISEIRLTGYGSLMLTAKQSSSLPFCIPSIELSLDKTYVKTPLVVRTLDASATTLILQAPLVATNILGGVDIAAGASFLNDRSAYNGTCSNFGNCTSCLGAIDCHWSSFERLCLPQGALSCDWIDAAADCPLSCEEHHDMQTCVSSDSGCVWCPSQRCESSNDVGTAQTCVNDTALLWGGKSGIATDPTKWMPPRVPSFGDALLVTSTYGTTIRVSGLTQAKSLTVLARTPASIQLESRLILHEGGTLEESAILYFSDSGVLETAGPLTIRSLVVANSWRVRFEGTGELYLYNVDAGTSTTILIAQRATIMQDNTWNGPWALSAGALVFARGTTQRFTYPTSFQSAPTEIYGRMVVDLATQTEQLGLSTVRLFGELDIRCGTVTLNGNSDIWGSIFVANGATLTFSGSNSARIHTLYNSSRVLSNGTINFSSPGSILISNDAIISTNVFSKNSLPTLILPSHAVIKHMLILSGNVQVTGNQTFEVDTLVIKAGVRFDCPVLVTSSFEMSSGAIQGSGNVTISCPTALITGGSIGGETGRSMLFNTTNTVINTVAGWVSLAAARVEFRGALWLGGRYLRLGGNVQIVTSGQTMSYASLSSQLSCISPCLGNWTNMGEMTLVGQNFQTFVPIHNRGTINVQRGTLTMSGTVSGTIVLAEQTNLVAASVVLEASGAVRGPLASLSVELNLQVIGELDIGVLELSATAKANIHPNAGKRPINMKTVQLLGGYWSASNLVIARNANISTVKLGQNTLIEIGDSVLVDFDTVVLMSDRARIHTNGTAYLGRDHMDWWAGTLSVGSGAAEMHLLGKISLPSSNYNRYISGGNVTVHDTLLFEGMLSSSLSLVNHGAIVVTRGAALTCAVACSISAPAPGSFLQIHGELNVHASATHADLSIPLTLEPQSMAHVETKLYVSAMQLKATVTGPGSLYLMPSEHTIAPSSVIDIRQFRVLTGSGVLPRVHIGTTQFFSSLICDQGYGPNKRQISLHAEIVVLKSIETLSPQCNVSLGDVHVETMTLAQGTVFVAPGSQVAVDDLNLRGGGGFNGAGRVVAQSFKAESFAILDTDVAIRRGSVLLTETSLLNGAARLTVLESLVMRGPQTVRFSGNSSLIVSLGSTLEIVGSMSLSVYGTAGQLLGLFNHGQVVFTAQTSATITITVPLTTTGTITLTDAVGVSLTSLVCDAANVTIGTDATLTLRGDSFVSNTSRVTGALLEVSSGNAELSAKALSLKMLRVSGGQTDLFASPGEGVVVASSFARHLVVDSGGQLNLLVGVQIPQFTHTGGTIWLAPAVTAVVTTKHTWTGGLLSGESSAVLRVDGRLVASGSNSKNTRGLSLVIQGTAVWGEGPLSIDGGRIVVSSGANFTVITSSPLNSASGGSLLVDGLLRVDLCSTQTIFFAPLNVTGRLETLGTLVLGNGGTISSTATVSLETVGAQLVASNGLLIANPGAIQGFGQLTITDNGHVAFVSGSLEVPLVILNGKYEVLEDHNLTITSNLVWKGGTVLGQGVTTTRGLLDWQAGTLRSALQVAASGRFSTAQNKQVISGGVLSFAAGSRSVHEQGTIWVNDGGSFVVLDGGVFTAAPTSSASLQGSTSGRVKNGGVISVEIASEINPYRITNLHNFGRLVAISGTLVLNGANLNPSSSVIGRGNVTAVGTLNLRGAIRITGNGWFACESCSAKIGESAKLSGSVRLSHAYLSQLRDTCPYISSYVPAASCPVSIVTFAGRTVWDCVYSSCSIASELQVINSGHMTVNGQLFVYSRVENWGTLELAGANLFQSASYSWSGQLHNALGATLSTQKDNIINTPTTNEGNVVVGENSMLSAVCLSSNLGEIHVDGHLLLMANSFCPRHLRMIGGQLSGHGNITAQSSFLSAGSTIFADSGGLQFFGDLHLNSTTYIVVGISEDAAVLNPIKVQGTTFIDGTTIITVKAASSYISSLLGSYFEFFAATNIYGNFTSAPDTAVSTSTSSAIVSVQP